MSHRDRRREFDRREAALPAPRVDVSSLRPTVQVQAVRLSPETELAIQTTGLESFLNITGMTKYGVGKAK